MHSIAGRRRWLVPLLAMAVLLGGAATAFVLLPRTTTADVSGGGTVTVEVPWSAGTPTIVTRPQPPPREDVPVAVRQLTNPVDIETGVFLGDASLTFSYDGLALPEGTDPAEDLVVLTSVPELGIWMPVDTTVDPVRRTAQVNTSHFSGWMLGVTDPEALRDDQELADRLKWSAGGALARIAYGEYNALECNADNPLMPVTILDPVALSSKVCQERRPDGTYRLDWVNTSGMPRVLTLPPGFVREDSFIRSTNQVFADALAVRHPGTAVVLDGERIRVRFTDADVRPDTRITARTDWNIYLLSLVRLVGAALLMDQKDQTTAARALDGVLTAGKLQDCLDKFSDEIRDGSNVAEAGIQTLLKCASEAADAIAEVEKALGIGAKLSVKTIGKKFRQFLELGDLLELARAEMNGMLYLAGDRAGVDTSVTIVPARAMGPDEARALPLTPLAADPFADSPGCAALSPGTTLPGAPADACVGVTEGDLDGNGDLDRLVLWGPSARDRATGDGEPYGTGAIGFLDDGTVAPLSESPAGWPDSEFGSVEQFGAARWVHLGDDERQQLLVTVTGGANTVHHVALAVGADRRLHAVGEEFTAGPFRFSEGGGAGSSSEFGCVTTGGAPAVASVGSVRVGDGRTPSGYGWNRVYRRLDDTTLRYLGREGGVSTEQDPPPGGGDCTAADPADRGPEVGVPGRAPDAPDRAAREFLAAVVDGDRVGVSRLLAGTGGDESWAPGAGNDPWVEARRVTQDDPSSWRAAELRCGLPSTGYDGASYHFCVFQPTGSPTGLYLRLRGTNAEGWTVAAAVAARMGTTS